MFRAKCYSCNGGKERDDCKVCLGSGILVYVQDPETMSGSSSSQFLFINRTNFDQQSEQISKIQSSLWEILGHFDIGFIYELGISYTFRLFLLQ